MVTTKLNLSMTEPSVRQIYAKQGDTGRVLDISLDQTPEDGTLRILRPDGVEVTSEAVTGGEISESGETVTFESMTEADVTELTVGIEPVQDLNGYDKPWVGGAGKNLLDPDVFVSGRSQYYNVNSDGSINVVANDSTAWNNVPYIPLKSGTYTLSWATQPSGQLRMKTSDDGYSAESYIGAGNKRYTFTLTDDGGIKLKIGINASYPYTEYLQLELGSSATSYSPYSNICPITGHDEVTVTDEGKNRLDNTVNSGQTLTFSGVSCTINSDGSVTVSGTATGSAINAWFVGGYGIVYKVKRLPAGTYTFTDFHPFYHYVDETILRSVPVTFASRSATFTFTKDWWLDGVRCPAAETGTEYNLTLYPQMELGSTATAYEPYRSNTYTTSLGQTVYGGTLDMVTGVLVVDRAMVDLGTLTWERTTTSVGTYRFYTGGLGSVIKKPTTMTEMSDLVCSQYVATYGNAPNASVQGICIHTNGNLMVYDSTLGTASATDFKTAMNGVTCVYPLATPLTYTLTAQQIKTLVGTNNVWASSGDIVNITFTYGGLLSELPSEATEIVGKCYCDVEQNGVSSMPFTLNVKKNERAT